MLKPLKSTKPSLREMETIERAYRQLLLEDLLSQNLQFRSGPYEAHIQFSNFCNMSCIMCWDGKNPKAEKAPDELLKKIDEQVAPYLSVITPYSGSEPLVWTWDETRTIAEDNGVLLCITTNGQYLDEKRFNELKDITETLLISIDSHIPEILELIRPGGNIQKVLANLETTAKLAKKNGVECIVNLVLMTLNAPHIAETIEHLGKIGIESVNVIQMLDVNGRSRFYDPLLQFSQEYISWIRQKCIATASEHHLRLMWNVGGFEEFDFRREGFVPALPRKDWNDDWDQRMRRMFPGFCRNVWNRLRIDCHGDVAPCCYAVEGELSLGNLNEQSFDQIWNGVNARDLRRGMLCGDVPSHCSACRYNDPIQPFSEMEFCSVVDDDLRKQHQREDETQLGLVRIAPDHVHRSEPPISVEFSVPPFQVQRFAVALAFAGETDEIHRFEATEFTISDNRVSLEVPLPIWNLLRTNVGYWINVWAIPSHPCRPLERMKESFAVIRHEPLERIANSTLRYSSDGALPIVDLGGRKAQGFPINSSSNRPSLHTATLKDVRGSVSSIAKEELTRKQGVRNWLNSLLFRPTTERFALTLNDGVVDGYFDKIIENDDSILIQGWLLFKTGAPSSVSFRTSMRTVVAKPVARYDIAMSFPKAKNALQSGFEVELTWDDVANVRSYQVQLVATNDSGEESVVSVEGIGNTADDKGFEGGPYWFGQSKSVAIG